MLEHVVSDAYAHLGAAGYYACNTYVSTCVLRYADGVCVEKMWWWCIVVGLDLVDVK